VVFVYVALMYLSFFQPWPLNGGRWGEELPHSATDIIVTGYVVNTQSTHTVTYSSVSLFWALNAKTANYYAIFVLFVCRHTDGSV